MKTTELRLGNWVRHDKEICRVSGLEYTSGIKVFTTWTEGWVANQEAVEPITITESLFSNLFKNKQILQQSNLSIVLRHFINQWESQTNQLDTTLKIFVGVHLPLKNLMKKMLSFMATIPIMIGFYFAHCSGL